MTHLAKFELHVTALDTGEPRSGRGGPMASKLAYEARDEAVSAFEDALRRRGLKLVQTGYGVTAEDV